MTKLNEKQELWIEKLKEGDKRFTVISRCNDERWYFAGGKCSEQILSLKVAIDRGNGLAPEYIYDFGAPEPNKPLYNFLIKNDSKMIFEDSNGTYSLGIKGEISSIKGIFIYIRTKEMHTFIFGNEKASSIKVIYKEAVETEDAISYCVLDIFASTSTESPDKECECFG